MTGMLQRTAAWTIRLQPVVNCDMFAYITHPYPTPTPHLHSPIERHIPSIIYSLHLGLYFSYQGSWNWPHTVQLIAVLARLCRF